MARFTEHRRPTAMAIAMFFGLLAAVVLIGAPASSEGRPSDTASFRYEVIKFDYTVRGQVSASRESSACIAGITQTIGGSVTNSPAELSPLELGKGELHIERDGTNGTIEAEESFNFDLAGNREVATECEGIFTTAASNQQCADTITTEMGAFGLIKAPVGDAARITWRFNQALGGEGGWAPNFVCGETASFERKEKCRSDSIALERLTRPTVRLPFRCQAGPTTKAPAGKGYDRYEAFSLISGVIKLRTEQDDR